MNRAKLARQTRGLGFTPQDAVRWLAPRELARAGMKAALSAVFADYADKREIQDSFKQGVIEVPRALPDSTEDCWIDYVADLGDGFDATYTIASLLAERSLTPQDMTEPLPRGSMLVLGGDEVYPTASAQAYEDRMTGPYRAAFPYAQEPPLLVALPGNHDWYDGLTSFLRAFTTGRSIGGWKTEQKRSYFAVQLPHRWWLVALDSQFESYIDEPQLRYFETNLREKLQPGDGVILCSASPTWLKTQRDADAFNPLFWFEKHYIRTKPGPDGERMLTGAEVRLWLTGDSHHYARYVEDLDMPDAAKTAARQMVTCGLGGAYMSETHDLPPGFRLLPEMSRSFREGEPFTAFRRVGATYPDQKASRSMAKDLAKPWKLDKFLLTRNPGLMPLIAGIHMALFMGLFLLFGQGAITEKESGNHGRIVALFIESTPKDVWQFSGKVFVSVFVLAALFALLPKFRDLRAPIGLRAGALAAALAQVVVLLGVFVLLACLMRSDVLDELWVEKWWDIAIIAFLAALAAGLGGLLGGVVFAISIAMFRSGPPVMWQMSGQAIEDGKGFLRIKIDSTGLLTVFPLVVDKINRDWTMQLFQRPMDSTTREIGPAIKVPRATTELPTPRLIEEPYSISRQAGPQS